MSSVNKYNRYVVRLPAPVYAMRVQCGDNLSYQINPRKDRMDEAAGLIFGNSHKLKNEAHLVEVHEHGGWWLLYTLSPAKGTLVVIGSANGEAVYQGEALELREELLKGNHNLIDAGTLKIKIDLVLDPVCAIFFKDDEKKPEEALPSDG